jgi:hypothetical protein
MRQIESKILGLSPVNREFLEVPELIKSGEIGHSAGHYPKGAKSREEAEGVECAGFPARVQKAEPPDPASRAAVGAPITSERVFECAFEADQMRAD